jgi:arylsulfatase A-like enzyme
MKQPTASRLLRLTSRTFVAAVTWVLLVASGWAADRPNILFLLSDDQAWAGLSCQMHPDMPESKHPYVETPHIAKLASEGIRFSAAYSPAPVCSPTRISLQTGRNPAALRWTKAAPPEFGHRLIEGASRKSILDEEVTIAEVLRGAGYATAHYGKWHLSGGGPEAHGYDESDGNTGNNDAAPHVAPNPVDIFGMGERAADFMKRSRDEERPFFIQMSYHALHYPENASPELVAKYRGKSSRGGDKEVGRAAMAEDLDRGVGELLIQVTELGLEDSTYVIYMSDNGGSNRRTLMGGKGDVWEGGIRVPLIVRGPGVAPNSWSHQRVVGYDLFPTFCRWAGVEEALPESLDGGDMTHLLSGSVQPVQRPREEIVVHFPHYQGDSPHSAILLGDYKLLEHYETGERRLFDLTKDISERNDLSSAKPEMVAALGDRLKAYLVEADAAMPTPNPDYDPTKASMVKRGGKPDKSGMRKGKGPGQGGKKGKKKREDLTEPESN